VKVGATCKRGRYIGCCCQLGRD